MAYPTHPQACGCVFVFLLAHVHIVPCWLKQDILPCQLPPLHFFLRGGFSSILALLQVQSLCDLKFKYGPLPGTTFPVPFSVFWVPDWDPWQCFLKRICMQGNFKGDSLGCDECVQGQTVQGRVDEGKAGVEQKYIVR